MNRAAKSGNPVRALSPAVKSGNGLPASTDRASSASILRVKHNWLCDPLSAGGLGVQVPSFALSFSFRGSSMVELAAVTSKAGGSSPSHGAILILMNH